MPHGVRNLSSPTRDQTWAPAVEVQSLTNGLLGKSLFSIVFLSTLTYILSFEPLLHKVGVIITFLRMKNQTQQRCNFVSYNQ